MERTIPEAPNSSLSIETIGPLMKATDGSIVVAELNKKFLQFIEEVMTYVDEVQKRVLAEILS